MPSFLETAFSFCSGSTTCSMVRFVVVAAAMAVGKKGAERQRHGNGGDTTTLG